MKLTFIGADHEVTGSCHCIQVGEKNIIVDYGMEQGQNHFVNQEMPFTPAQIDYVFITHAHIDHTGLLPLLYARGFRGQIYATNATVDLCSIMLRDCAHIQSADAEWKNRKRKRSGGELVEPLYTMNDADGAIRLLVPCNYGEMVTVCPEITVRFVDAGHLLGSAHIEMWLKEDGIEKKIVFSGDIGNKDQPLIKDPSTVDEADYVVMESTYGNRSHNRSVGYEEKLASIIKDTFERGGNVVIPCFAVGRTQEVLYFLRKIKQENLVPAFQNAEVYVDSPLAVEATNIFNENIQECFDEETLELVRKGINPIKLPGLRLTITSTESQMINFDPKPKVILSASGMCDAGRIRHHLKHNLWRKESTIVFAGYQAVGTLGRVLLDGQKTVKLFGEEVQVNAKIEKIEGISGHADREGLIHWITNFKEKPQQVFVVHGDDTVCESFAELLTTDYGLTAKAPYSGAAFDLIKNCWVAEGVREEITKKPVRAMSHVFDRLMAAGYRLLSVIKSNEGLANKELAKFADQINALCDKWEKK